MSADSFQLMGMAERGMLPSAFAHRSRHGTPTLAIFFSAGGILVLSLMSFIEIVRPFPGGCGACRGLRLRCCGAWVSGGEGCA